MIVLMRWRRLCERLFLTSANERPESRWRSQASAPATPLATPEHSGVPREYLSLHTYLDKRFANTVVLTFAQIEDLLGHALPELARLHRGWWENADANSAPSAQSLSWIQASRNAIPNLLAQTVAFERSPA